MRSGIEHRCGETINPLNDQRRGGDGREIGT
jgi:hypothetical protein